MATNESGVYFVTEVGSFGSMKEFQSNDPTETQVDQKKKKKQQDELILEAIEINRRNLIK